jgi:hypothetical protein
VTDELAGQLRTRRELFDELKQALDALNELECWVKSAIEEVAARRELMSRLVRLRNKLNRNENKKNWANDRGDAKATKEEGHAVGPHQAHPGSWLMISTV